MVQQDPFTPRPEYPRPQFVRNDWVNLNGVWEFAFDDANAGLKEGWGSRETPLGGDILVPFPFQARMSGIGDHAFHDIFWYARWFDVPEEFDGREIMLRFGAVDYECTVWVNGCQAGSNRGGHVPFSFNITPFLRQGQNRIVVRVVDGQDKTQPRGKQFWELKPEGCCYSRTSGIWQTVWLEPLPPRRVESVRITPDIDRSTVRIEARLTRPGEDNPLSLRVLRHGKTIGEVTVRSPRGEVDVEMHLGKVELWSPEKPNLYDLELTLHEGPSVLDSVTSYFGMRKFSREGRRLFLNNKPHFQLLVLDQGYYPDTLLSAPCDDAIKADVEWAKRFGFNGVRKHQKVEDPRFLYWCDQLGLLVWGEMANAWEYQPEAEAALMTEWERVVRRDYNHPCLVVWVPFNESWGVPEVRDDIRQQAFVRRVVRRTREMDATRLVVDNDGWEHTGETDLCTIHDYTPCGQELHDRYARAHEIGQLPAAWDHRPIWLEETTLAQKPLLFTEVGGYLAIPEGLPEEERDLLYRYYGSISSEKELMARYRSLMNGLAQLGARPMGLAGFCYTQLTDVEQELNGLLTFDRQPKVDPRAVAAIHRRLFSRVPTG